MGYEKTNWTNQETPINEENLNNLETQYEEAVKTAEEMDEDLESNFNSQLNFIRADGTKAMRVEVRTSDPESPVEGQIWFRSDL